MKAQPSPPTDLQVALPLGLGRLGAPLLRLARAQGNWPPVTLTHPVTAPLTPDWDTGLAAGDALVDEGANLIVVGGGQDCGPALTLLAALLHLEPVAAVGTAATPGWVELVRSVRTGLRASREHLSDLIALVESVHARPVAGLAGVLSQAAVRRTPVLLSGAADAVAAAVLAERVGPGTSAWLLGGCSAPAGAAAVGLAELELPVLLDLRLGGPEGADLALEVLHSAVRLAQR